MKSIPRTGKRHRPKTAIKGKRYRCAICHKRSPKPVKTPAPWYCPRCLAAREAADAVPEGVRGWGAKGVLDLRKIRSLAKG